MSKRMIDKIVFQKQYTCKSTRSAINKHLVHCLERKLEKTVWPDRNCLLHKRAKIVQTVTKKKPED